MKRLTSIVLNKHDRPDGSSNGSSGNTTIDRPVYFSKAPKAHVTIPRPFTTILEPSSSSDGSSSSIMPEDDGSTTLSDQSRRMRFSTWFGSKKHSEAPFVDTRNESNKIASHRISLYKIQGFDYDTHDSNSNDEEFIGSPHPIVKERPAVADGPDISMVAKSQSILLALTQNGLIPIQSPSPFLDSKPAVYPRSSNFHRYLPHLQTMEIDIHRTHLLRRLKSKDLSIYDEATIAAYASREKLPVIISQREISAVETLALGSIKVNGFSRGLRRWLARPCFEERAVLWTVDDLGTVKRRRVEGTSRALAVAALEFSEYLENLSGYEILDGDEQGRLPISRSQSVPLKTALNVIPQSASNQLRIIVDSPAVQALSPAPSSAISTDISTPDLLLTPPPLIQRGVRFADEFIDQDDDIPLAVSIRIKKEREEKEVFLQKEREKRLYIQRAREERELEDRRTREQQQKLFIREVLAARERRESQRQGSENFVTIRNQHSRQYEPLYSRPDYDNARRASMKIQSSEIARTKDKETVNKPDDVKTFDSFSNRSHPASRVRPSVIHADSYPQFQSGSSVRSENIGRSKTDLSSTTHMSLPRPHSSSSSTKRNHALNPWPITPSPSIALNAWAYPPLLPPSPPFVLQQRQSVSHLSSGGENRFSSYFYPSVPYQEVLLQAHNMFAK